MGLEYFLNLKNKIKTYFTKSLDETEIWIAAIKKMINFKNFKENYTIIKTINKSKINEMLLCENKLKNKVVVKLFPKSLFLDMEYYSIYKNELEILKLSKHKNIVNLLDNFEDNDNFYLVLEYLQNEDLKHNINNYDSFQNEKYCLQLIYQICQAIEYLHNAGICHRDIKPENIGLDKNNILKLLDFRLGSFLFENQKNMLPCGTINYIAPEMFLNQFYNKEVDIWSLGVLIYYIISGTLPFEEDVVFCSHIKRTIIFRAGFFSQAMEKEITGYKKFNQEMLRSGS